MDYRYDLFQWQREKLGVTYSQIAERCGRSKNIVYLTIEGKTNPTATTLNDISDGLNLNPKFALDKSLQKNQFWRAVVVTAR